MAVFNLTSRELVNYAEGIKGIILRAMADQGLLTEEQAQWWNNEYVLTFKSESDVAMRDNTQLVSFEVKKREEVGR